MVLINSWRYFKAGSPLVAHAEAQETDWNPSELILSWGALFPALSPEAVKIAKREKQGGLAAQLYEKWPESSLRDIGRSFQLPSGGTLEDAESPTMLVPCDRFWNEILFSIIWGELPALKSSKAIQPLLCSERRACAICLWYYKISWKIKNASFFLSQKWLELPELLTL